MDIGVGRMHEQLKNFSTEKLAEWGDIFNQGGWPSDYVLKKPEDWDTLITYSSSPHERTKYTVARIHIYTIGVIIGYKEGFRYHHIHNLKMANWQFEAWWLFHKLTTFLGKFLPSFYIDIYSVMGWRQ